ncbi:MAG: hypothetical protein HY040_05895 [Planctomycetes bacterium]|nr:hypothetical protein [Planctomycetota bacterium]
MPTGILFGLPQGQLEAFEEALAVGKEEIELTAKDERKKARLANDVKGFLALCREIPRVLRRECDSVLDLMAAGGIEDYGATGLELRRSFAKAIEILNGVQELVQTYLSTGSSLAEANAHVEVIEGVKQQEYEFFAHWPDFRQEDIEGALSDFQHGDCLEIDEAFAQAKGISKDKWSVLVEREIKRRNS